MVKNNILLTVLLASFAAPVLASNWIPKDCPLNEKGQLAVGFAAVEFATNRFFSCRPAIELNTNQRAKWALTEKNKTVSQDVVDVSAAVGADNHNAADKKSEDTTSVNPKTKNKILERVESTGSQLLNTSFTVDLKTVGIDAGVTVNVVPTVIKVGATVALLQSAKLLVNKFLGQQVQK